MIRRLIRSKKLKRVKRVPKSQKFKFEDERQLLNSKSNYIKSCIYTYIDSCKFFSRKLIL